jgi:hypothetical protein
MESQELQQEVERLRSLVRRVYPYAFLTRHLPS